MHLIYILIISNILWTIDYICIHMFSMEQTGFDDAGETLSWITG